MQSRHGTRRLLAAALCAALLIPQGVAAEGVSAGRAFWSSLLLPGWGQLQQGRTRSAAVFALAELTLWGGFVGWRQIAEVRRNNARAYAAEHAGALTRGKGDAFLDDLGFYADVQQHNAFARRDDGPDAQLYPSGRAFFWEWDADASRKRFRQLRNAGEAGERNALYTTGLIAVNRLLSAVHAARVARGAGPTAYRLEAAPLQSGWALALRRSF